MYSGIRDLALDPNNPDAVLVAAGPDGAYRSSKKADGDTVFHLIFKPSDPSHRGYSEVRMAAADLGRRTRLYITDSDGQANPDQNGQPQGVAHVYRLDDASTRATPGLAAHGPSTAWKKLSSNSITKPGFPAFRYCQKQCDYSNFVATPPGRPNQVWLGGMFEYAWEVDHDWHNGRAVLRSTDGGLTWNDLTTDAQSPPYMLHPDQHSIAFSPDDPAVAFIGSDGGIVRTNGTYVDRSRQCATRGLPPVEFRQCRRLLAAIPQRIIGMNQNLDTLQFQSVSISPPGQPLELLGGTQDNGTWSYSKSRGWVNAAGGDGGQSVVGKGPSPPHIHSYYGVNLRVNFNGFDQASWRAIYPPLVASGEQTAFYVPLISDPDMPGLLFVGLQHVWRTGEYGGTQKILDDNCDETRNLSPTCGKWVPLGQALTGSAFGIDRADEWLNFVAAIARAPSDDSTLWAATSHGRVFIAQNAEAPSKSVVFKRIDIPTPTLGTKKGTPGRFVSGIVVDPDDPMHAWVSFSGYSANTPNDVAGHVFEVTFDPASGKATWTNRSYDLGDQPITGLARDPRNGDLYAATDFGVLRLPAGAAAWTEAAKGLPFVAVYGLTLAGDGTALYAATHGRGIWALKLR